MHQFFIIQEKDKSRGTDCLLRHIIDFQAAAVCGRRLKIRSGVSKDVIENATELTLDFEKLEYISSAGLRVLLATQKVLGKKGGMKLIHVNETIMEVFEVTGFSDILTVE